MIGVGIGAMARADIAYLFHQVSQSLARVVSSLVMLCDHWFGG
jgi:hypothetical protein